MHLDDLRQSSLIKRVLFPKSDVLQATCFCGGYG